MTPEIVFRIIMGVSFLVLLGIRIHYQKKVLSEEKKFEIQENKLSLVAGSIAALTSITFGFEYLFFYGTFCFTYLLDYPDWLRWIGVIFLVVGVGLMWWAHYHLDRSFYSLVASKEDQKLVTSGPYRWILHPIYTAYLMTYISGGLATSNLVLTVVPGFFFGLMIINRIPREEALMREAFGQEYIDLEIKTGRLLPKIIRGKKQ